MSHRIYTENPSNFISEIYFQIIHWFEVISTSMKTQCVKYIPASYSKISLDGTAETETKARLCLMNDKCLPAEIFAWLVFGRRLAGIQSEARFWYDSWRNWFLALTNVRYHYTNSGGYLVAPAKPAAHLYRRGSTCPSAYFIYNSIVDNTTPTWDRIH